MRRSTTRLCRALVAGCLPLGLVSAGSSASAAPPEGCVGFPDIPAAFVCVTQFTPGNAVPAVAPGPGQTYTIPRFCVFDCFDPTPVTVPTVTITEGNGVVAVIHYNGQTYPVVVPSSGSVPATVQAAQQQVSAAVATVLGTADGAAQQATGTAAALQQQAKDSAAALQQQAINTANAAAGTAGTLAQQGIDTANAAAGTAAALQQQGIDTANAAAGTAGTLAQQGIDTANAAAGTAEAIAESTAGTATDLAFGVVGEAASIAFSRHTFVLTGEAHVPHFGQGDGRGTMNLSGTVVSPSGVAISGPGSATFSYYDPPNTCPLDGSANGSMVLPVVGEIQFTWTRYGGNIAMSYTTESGHTGAATGLFVVTDPPGSPCGPAPVTASVVLSGGSVL